MVNHGINIFTNAFNRMKYFIFIIFLLGSLGSNAQVYIEADVTSGCNPLMVRFNIQPESARDSITAYEWNFGNWTTVITDSIPNKPFDLTGTFSVICTIFVNENFYQIDKNENAEKLTINIFNCDSIQNTPNVFTPNEDSENDFFIIDTDGTTTYNFSVFTRSGTLIFKSESPSIIWDGRSMSGQEMGTGIYYYTIHRSDDVYVNEVKDLYNYSNEFQ